MKGEIDFDGTEFVLRSKYDPTLVMMAKGAPDRKWDKATKQWRFALSLPNVNYIGATFPPEMLTPAAKDTILTYEHATPDTPFPDWYRFPAGVTPRPWQQAVLDKAWNKDGYALFWEMRLGKTFVAVTLASAYHQAGDIEKVVVVGLNSLKQTWNREFASWGTSATQILALDAGKKISFPQQRGRPLQVVVVGVESLSAGGAYKKVCEWVAGSRYMVIVDESSRIKNFKAERTKRVVQLGKDAVRRLILTGTPITQGMQDLYSQFDFLGPDILGFNSFYSFRNRFCVMEEIRTRSGQSFTKIAGYQNTNELLTMVQNYAHRLRVSDVVADLPDRVYEERWVTPSPQQKKAYSDLKKDMRVAMDDKELTVENILERMTRFQQIAGGFLPLYDEEGNPVETLALTPNPKVDELKSILEDLPNDEKVIIWCRFRAEIAIVARTIAAMDIGLVVEYHGGIPKEVRDDNEREFQSGNARFFVGNQATAGMGLELSAAGVVIYYSNSFSYEDRVQSEARAQHVDKKTSVMYIDLFNDLAVERAVSRALAAKTGLAEYVSAKLQGKTITDIFGD